MKKLIPTLSVLFVLTASIAQSVSDESLRECLAIEGLAERLICYDSLAENMPEIQQTPQAPAVQVPQSSVQEEPKPDNQVSSRQRTAPDTSSQKIEKSSSGSWVYSKSVDDFDDSTSYWLYSTAISKDTGYDHDDVYLVVGCLHEFQKLVFAVNWDTFLGSEGKQIETIYRIGSQPAERVYWRALDGIADFSASPNIILKLLDNLVDYESEKFLVKTEAYSKTVTAEFDLTGLSQVLNQILEPCGW